MAKMIALDFKCMFAAYFPHLETDTLSGKRIAANLGSARASRADTSPVRTFGTLAETLMAEDNILGFKKVRAGAPRNYFAPRSKNQ